MTARCTIACALSVLLAGCRCGRQPAREAAEITFWHIQTTSPTKEVLEAAVRRFEVRRAGFTVKVSAIQNDPYKRKLAVAMTAGAPPDVFYTWGGGVLAADARAGRVLDLTERVSAEHLGSLNAATLEFCRTDGRLYALPADVAAVVFWYNRRIFEEHGLAPPRTLDEFIAVCQRLKDAGVTPLALGNADMWPGAFYFSYFALRRGGLPPFTEALARRPGPGFEHAAFIEAGRLSRMVAEKGFFNRGFNGVDDVRARQLFFEGRAAMLLMGPWILGNARKEAPEGFVNNIGCFAFPMLAGSSADASLVLGGVNAGYAVAAGCRHPEAAVALVTELTGIETAKEWAKTGRIPALKLELLAPLLPPETREVAGILGRAAGIQLYYDQALPPDLADVHKSTTQGLLAGSRTPEEAARIMEECAKAAAAREPGGP